LGKRKVGKRETKGGNSRGFMIATRCSFCESRKIIYRNGLLSIMEDGLQVEFAVCSRHSGWEYRIQARQKAEKKLERLERAHQRGKPHLRKIKRLVYL